MGIIIKFWRTQEKFSASLIAPFAKNYRLIFLTAPCRDALSYWTNAPKVQPPTFGFHIFLGFSARAAIANIDML